MPPVCQQAGKSIPFRPVFFFPFITFVSTIRNTSSFNSGVTEICCNALSIGGSSSRLFHGSFTSEMDMAPNFCCCSNHFLMFSRMSFGFLVYESNIWTLLHRNPFVFALFYLFTSNYSMPFINYFLRLCPILQGFGVYPSKHYLFLLKACRLKNIVILLE